MRRTLAALFVATLTFIVAGSTAHASSSASSSDCDVRIADHRFVNGSRVHLHSKRAAVIAVTAPTERPRYKVEVDLAGVRSTVGTGRGRDFGWHRALDVRNAATYGVGTYRLHVITYLNGRTCAITGRIDITGRAPVTTAAGAAAAAATVIGALALLTALARRGGRPLRTRHAFVVEDPLGQFVAVDTPGNYVGWAEVTCDVGARTFVTTKTSADEVRDFMRHEATRARLTDIRAKGVRVRPSTDGGPDVPRLRWRPRFYILSPLLGILGGLGAIAYMQQDARIELTQINLAIAAAAGLGAGLIVANLTRLLATMSLNRRLKTAERGIDHVDEVVPRYPPIDHLDELDTFVWTPTHTVPTGGDGQAAWTEPDRTKDKAATLDPGLPVRVVDRRDGLAQVVCSNGWVGWTEAEPLKDIDA